MNTAAETKPESLPFNLDAEEQVIGVCLLRNEKIADVSVIIQPDHFYEAINSEIYRTILDYATNGRPATLVTLKNAFDHIEWPEGMTSRRYLAHLAASTAAFDTVVNYARMVRDLACRRSIIQEADKLIHAARSMPITASPAVSIEQFSESVRPILDSDDRSKLRWAGDLGFDLVDRIERVAAGELHFETFTTGFDPLDNVTRYRPEEVIVTAGRPGSGKSIFCTAAARRIAQSGVGVLEFPLENGAEQAISRHAADLSYSSNNAIFFSKILDNLLPRVSDRERVAKAMDRLNEFPLIIEDSSRITLARLDTRIKQTKRAFAARGFRLGVVMLDHLDYIDATDRYSGNRVQEIFEIMTGLKSLARREKIQIHLFCQLNRQVEARASNDRRPQLQDLRNSGDIEQCADVVNFLYREAYYAARSPEYARSDPDAVANFDKVKNDLDVICAKVRTGPTVTVRLFCDPAASYISGRLRG
jgi:replicative DNA helicase